MGNTQTESGIEALIRQSSDTLNPEAEATAIILAAGHGKRIKSERSKMLHKIWGKTTVERVSAAARKGLHDANICLVVGIKAESVIQTVGKRPNQVFVYQEEQKGTGHAVQVALQALPDFIRNQTVYVFPGDIGLLRPSTARDFRKQFRAADADMMVLTGQYEGDPADNYYGRILRVPVQNGHGEGGKVLQIMEHRDIRALKPSAPYTIQLDSKEYAFDRQDLLEIREFNTGIFAFNGDPLLKNVSRLSADNVQGELYLTDLIKIFNQQGCTVQAAPARNNRDVIGFNNKSVLKQMNSIYKKDAYDQLKDIVSFRDPDDFFICDEMVRALLEMDKNGSPLDINIGKSVYINGNVQFSRGVTIKDNVNITGNVILGKGVTIHKGAEISTYPHQTLEIGDYSIIFQENIIKGNTRIGGHCRIESGVNVTGSDKYPTVIGDRVMIKGTSYIFGSTVEENAWIEHCVLKTKKVHCHFDRNGEVAPIRYVIPQPEGLDDVESIGDDREEYTWPPAR